VSLKLTVIGDMLSEEGVIDTLIDAGLLDASQREEALDATVQASMGPRVFKGALLVASEQADFAGVGELLFQAVRIVPEVTP
jgi:hypothetical protein